MTTEDKKQPVNEKPLAEFIAEKKADTSWKKDPWIDTTTGEVFRKNRVQKSDGTFKEFTVRVHPPEEGK
jgi:hypothetical protein